MNKLKLLVALLAVSLTTLANAGDYKYHQPKRPTNNHQPTVNTNIKTDVDVNNHTNNHNKNTNQTSTNIGFESNQKQNQNQTQNTNSYSKSGDSSSSANGGVANVGGSTLTNTSNSMAGDSSSSSGGNSLATGSTTTTNISNMRTQFLNLPTHVVPVAPSIIAGANVVQSVGACGVLQQVKREEVKGTYHGLFTDSQISLGFRETLTGYVDSNGNPQLFKQQEFNGILYIIGHQPVIVSSVVATGGARQFGLGGNSSSGNNGSGSLGSSGANQQMVEHIQLTECIFQVIDNRQPTPTTNAIVPTVPTISKKIPE